MDNTPTTGQSDRPEDARPGDTITPATAFPAPAAMPTAHPDSASPVNDAQPAPASVATQQPAQLATAALPPTQPDTTFNEAAATIPAQPNGDQGDDEVISWTAAEFIAHNKSAAWYGLLAAAVLVLAALVFLFTKDKISTTVVLIAGIALGGYGARKPQQRQYSLDDQGVSIGDKFLPYGMFRSFAIIDEDQVSSISFFPLKRFGQLTTIYYNPEDEEDIVGLLADRLPMDDRSHDMLDRFMKHIRF